MHWSAYEVFSVLTGAILIVAGLAIELDRERFWFLVGGVFAVGYGFYVASQETGIYLFPVWIFVVPVAAVVYAVVVIYGADGEKTASSQPESASRASDRLKTCPRCAEDVRFAALVCRFCGHEFPVLKNTSASATVEREEDGVNSALSDGPQLYEGQEVIDPMEHAFGVTWGRTSSGEIIYKERGQAWKAFAADETNLIPPPGYRR